LARQLRAQGARAGLGLKPATPIESYIDVIGEFDMVLLMTVEPGFGGQSFLDVVLPKIRRTRELLRQRDASVWVQVDGGIGPDTIERAAQAGADVFVAGSAVYAGDDPGAVVAALRAQAEKAVGDSWWGPPSA
jgi:ribulose-phosphate 3-epimerase